MSDPRTDLRRALRENRKSARRDKPLPEGRTTNRAQTRPAPLPGRVTETCGVCGGHYLPDGEGRKAHVVVMGHLPDTAEVDPAEVFEVGE